MVREGRPIELSVAAGPGNVKSEEAVSIGLIVTGLRDQRPQVRLPSDITAGQIVVGYTS